MDALVNSESIHSCSGLILPLADPGPCLTGPNRVLERQRQLQSDPRFIHQKMPRSGLYMSELAYSTMLASKCARSLTGYHRISVSPAEAYLTLFACGLGGALYGTQAM